MDENTAREMAAQLRKPEGEAGLKTAAMMSQGNAHMNRAAIGVVNPSPNDNILELGMANGSFINEIVSVHPSIQYTGVDFSETMVYEASRLNGEWIGKGQVNLVFASASNLPFFEDNFNKVFTVNTIYFWDNESKVLAELSRVLAPGGRLIISIRPRHQMEKYPFTRFGFRMYSGEEVASLLKSAGFIDIETFENREPSLEINGETYTMENVVVTGTKAGD
jgi:ubiquinone/menaquinone biosynthesis C-methylase UbiE